MSITATELKKNMRKYLVLASDHDILITVDGKAVAQLSKPKQDKVETIKSIFGILPNDITLEEVRAERLASI